MDLKFEQSGDDLVLRIPKSLAERLGLNAEAGVELREAGNAVVIQQADAQQARQVPTLKALLDSVPEGFRYPEDVSDFVNSAPVGRELI